VFCFFRSRIIKGNKCVSFDIFVKLVLYALLKEQGIKPDVVAGYGIGQYTAIYVASGLSFPDALYVLKKYSEFYEEVYQLSMQV